jgi:hypothetical protein
MRCKINFQPVAGVIFYNLLSFNFILTMQTPIILVATYKGQVEEKSASKTTLFGHNLITI